MVAGISLSYACPRLDFFHLEALKTVVMYLFVSYSNLTAEIIKGIQETYIGKS